MLAPAHRGHFLFFGPLLFAGLVGAVAACNIGLSSSDEAASSKASGNGSFNEPGSPEGRGVAAPPSPADAQGATSGADAGVARNGSPLCGSHAYASTCSPDDTSLVACSASPAGDASAGGDAGAPFTDASAPHALEACRVREEGDASRVAVCAAAGMRGDGAECLRSSDCAAGFECVRSPGRCRRYCCGSTCDDAESFCDLQPTASTTEQPGLLVPVCSATTACKLLGTTCASGETCAVVKQDGTTSCVGVGRAKDGEECEHEQCAADYSCLGQPGYRKCFRLCVLTDMKACPTGQTCRGTAPLFKDANVGVCE